MQRRWSLPGADGSVWLVGGALDSRNLLRRHFRPVLKAAKLPEEVRFYDLRHTCATLLLVAGEHAKKVSELLEHSSITITIDAYSHVLPGMQRELAAKLDTMLLGSKLLLTDCD